jgi:uncharacterized protein (DUF58 family)
MTSLLIFAVAVLVLLAAFLREPALLTPAYLLLGAWLIGRWWGSSAMAGLRFGRSFANKAFLNDKVAVKITVENPGRLPVPWLRLHDSLHVALGPPMFNYAISLRPREVRHFEYVLQATRRGHHAIGPLTLTSGDVLGLDATRKVQGAVDWLTVYPRVVALPRLALPSRTVLGVLRHTQPIYEDPSRVRGKRDYANGDSLRRVDWKATARLSNGHMQVKLFEPSVTLQALMVLNLNRAEYDRNAWIDGTELAIVVAASLANWLIENKQAAGLLINQGLVRGAAPTHTASFPNTACPKFELPPRKGRGHMIQILEALAHANADGENVPLLEACLHKHLPHLGFGTTLVVITGKTSAAAVQQLLRARQHGLSPVLVSCGLGAHFQQARAQCDVVGIPAYHVLSEMDIRKLAL